MTTIDQDRVPEMLNWREARNAPTPDIDELAARIPPMCGMAGAPGDFRDMNTTWECDRSARIYQLHSSIDEMRKMAERRAHNLARSKTYYFAANLNAWLIWKAGQIEFLLRRYNFPEMSCTHAEPREFADHNDALPGCGC